MKKLTLLMILMSFTLASACTPSGNWKTEQSSTGFTDRSGGEAHIELAKRPKPKPTETPKPRKTPDPKPQPKPSLKQI